MGEQRDYRGPQSPKQCMECCEAECREQCRQNAAVRRRRTARRGLVRMPVMRAEAAASG